jgi:hypothetical protein
LVELVAVAPVAMHIPSSQTSLDFAGKLWHTSGMVKAKLEKHIKQDPVSVIILILVFMALSVGVLIYMHFLQNREIRQLREDVTTLQRDTHTR